MFDTWQEELTEEQREELIGKAAEEIKKRKLEVPASLMLEMHRPLANVFAHGTLALSPFLVPFVGFDGVNNYSRLFADPENVLRLLDRLDRKSPENPPLEESCN
jgi:hypothetical protein